MSKLHRLIAAATAITALTAGPFAWSNRYSLNPDGMSYIDIARQVAFRGDWGALLNLHWSPAYPLLMSGLLRVVNPGIAAEFPMVHLLNWLIFILAAVAFGWFVRELLLGSPVDGKTEAADAIFIAFAYSVLFWATNNFAPLALVTPDLLAMSAVFAAAAAFLRIISRPERAIGYIILGATLALGYMIKAALFPLGLVFLAILFAHIRKCWSIHWKRFALSVLTFLALSTPLILGLSSTANQITTGKSGALNYLSYVNGFEPPSGWPMGEWIPSWSPTAIEKYGRPEHPVAVISRNPLTVAFGDEVPGTYPPWYDPWHWCAGLTPRLEVKHWFWVVWNQIMLWKQLAVLGAPFIAGAVMLWLLGNHRRKAVPSLWAIIWFTVSLLLFSAIHLEWRYVAAFIALAAVTSLFDLGRNAGSARAPLLLGISAGLLAPFLVDFAVVAATGVEDLRHPTTPDVVCRAEELRRAGLETNDRIAVLGRGTRGYFAHLAGVRIVAEIRNPEEFRALSQAARSELLARLRSVGVRALVDLSQEGCGTASDIELLGDKTR
jgi:hypothetical protein